MKALILALYAPGARHQDAWLDHGAAITYQSAKEAGADVAFLDMKALSDLDELRRALRPFDLVAFGMKSVDYTLGMSVVEAAKAEGKKVLIAGAHVAAAPNELLENDDIDYVFHGESEITFPEFLADSDGFGREIRGKRPQDLDALPFIDREVFREPLEDSLGWLGTRTMTTVVSSRGCPFNCGFCQPLAKRHFGKSVRRRSVANVIEELRMLKQKYRPELLMIHDDTFILKRAWLEEFIEAYPEIGLPFWASGRADTVVQHRDLIPKLARAGLRLLSVGFESGSQRVLDILHKGTTVEDNYEAARIAKDAGVDLYGNYMLGVPGETEQDLLATVKMMDEIGAYVNAMAFFSPYPGNYLGEKCIDEGLSLLDRSQYHRNPYGEKVKGVDYALLNRIVEYVNGRV